MNFCNSRDWKRPVLNDSSQVQQRVAELLQKAAIDPDTVIAQYSQHIDGFAPQCIPLFPFDKYALAPSLKDAIKLAATRIKRFAEQHYRAFDISPLEDAHGRYEVHARPLNAAAAYIPGGKAPLISSALMTLIPAAVAGVNTRIAMSPSTHPAILAAASLAGATQFWRIGGAQAIAAATFGYKQLPACDIIVGPGNAYVAEAKKQVQTRVRIDSIAGPSEVLIVANENTRLDWILMDAMAQAEHGDDALAIIVSRSVLVLEQLQKDAQKNAQANTLLASGQLQLVYAENADEIIRFCNTVAPEHLMLCDDGIPPSALRHYGALFIGDRSPVALGDYLSGPNHTLPTEGNARRYSGLSVADFMRWQTIQHIVDGTVLYENAAILADTEGLNAHSRSLHARIEKLLSQ